jgi:hypothetical protein
MSVVSRCASFLRSLLLRRQMEDEMDAEMRLHIREFVEDPVRSGASRVDAERSAHWGIRQRTVPGSAWATPIRRVFARPEIRWT